MGICDKRGFFAGLVLAIIGIVGLIKAYMMFNAWSILIAIVALVFIMGGMVIMDDAHGC